MNDKVKKLEELVNQGDMDAMFSLAYLYHIGDGVTINYEKAKELYERAIYLGNVTALNNLACMYLQGQGIPKNINKAKELYEMAIEKNNARAMVNLAILYEDGVFGYIDCEKSKSLYERAIHLENETAVVNLTSLYLQGKLKIDNDDKIKELCEIAIEKKSAGSLYNLGLIYYKGKFVQQDYYQAKKLFEKAIDLGMDKNHIIFKILEEINEVIQSKKIQNHELEKLNELIKQNNSDAMVKLAVLYYEGKEVAKDYQKAKELLEQAMKLKNPEAFEKLAFMYVEGFFSEDKKDNFLNAINLLEQVKTIYEELYQKTKNEENLNLKTLADEKIKFLKGTITLFYIDIDEEKSIEKDNKHKKVEKLRNLITEIEKKYVARNTTIRMLANNIYHGRMAIEQIADEKIVRNNISTILLVSSTGGGKTAIVSDIAKQFEVPWTKASLSAGYTQAGYKGLDLQDIFLDLIDKSGNDIKKAEQGIVILDEFDKIRVNEDTSNKEFVKALQKELLTYLEGAEIKLQTSKGVINFNTSKITFILAGAFQDVTEYDMNYTEEELKELVSKGYEPELIGRINIFHYMPKYNKADYIKILNNSEISPLNNFIVSCSIYGKKVITSPYSPFIESVAIEAVKLDKGVRGLNNIFANILSWHLNDLIYGDSDIVLLDSYENLKRKKNRGK